MLPPPDPTALSDAIDPFGGLFADSTPSRIDLDPGVALLPGFALTPSTWAAEVLAGVHTVSASAGWRHMHTPGGLRMQVAMCNAGPLGWVSDRRGYRYSPTDPLTGLPWPPLPTAWLALARTAADAAGFPGFEPDACLVNRYAPGTRLSLHQDLDEQGYDDPIVSVSLGVPATFLLGGLQRGGSPRPIPLVHGDVLVWGGPARLRFHGVKPIAANHHPAFGSDRVNLTFRRAG